MKLSDFIVKLPFFKDIKEEQVKKVSEAEIAAKEILIKAREEALKVEKEAEDAAKKATHETIELEKRLHYKENELEAQRKRTESERKRIEADRQELTTKREEILSKLEKIAKLTQQEAKDLILKAWEEKLKGDIAHKIKQAEEQVKNTVDEKAREMFVDAIRYGAVDFTPEYTLAMVMLPNEEFKGRIIGKEGRNIRSFELATGVDVDLEEEGVIKFSSFDAIRREIARVSMERLIKDGRIQPSRIEEIVHKTKEEVDKLIIKAGEELCYKAGVHDMPHDLVKMLGRFKYRYSYGQNMILHTLEETRIGVALAHELKADVNVVRLGCLLHDIGKIVTDKEGSHVQLGVDLLKKYKITQQVIDCVASHHEDVPFASVEAVIVYIADAVSGGRPGARHEDFQEYLKRIDTIEGIVKKRPGIIEAYALQAGRELRIVVKPEEISDDQAVVLAEKIREDINEKFPTFPGQVKITVIREFRAFATSHS
ncbi:ribonuclease Y [Candidatus Roizmanbacteria bacterium RIFCSPLOWO2_02_FULL_38_10]|uniref:Ribonuclease Y n=1 Tax=Candidatus Roizmanbacteria bacterium RIFCSPLOWO2_02_FULL_38_10 TaxID=1802074 RepID=A0A1F7JPE6_9BACT|nr:MAG: ribonuclease Y [Candidatus Roizmanbacteria bacterium RIFCSPLOWO2_02_FULL_38_10]